MKHHQAWQGRELFFLLMAWAFVIVLQGTIPGYMLPTLGQMVWTSGFAESLSHSSFFTMHVHDFGLPEPAAIAFGLTGAFSMSLLLRLGLSTVNAYPFMMLLWFSLAFFSAYGLARNMHNTRSAAILGALTWMSMPIIWGHAGYSLLSLGFALLPFYFLSTFYLLRLDQSLRLRISCYFLVTVIAVFMDGYTFMMFFCGASVLIFYQAKTSAVSHLRSFKKIFWLHFLSFAIAYILFAMFIGHLHFAKSPLYVFRALGLDLSFIAIPAHGMHWITDVLNISARRSVLTAYGDSSVWTATFSLPILLAGLLAFLVSRKDNKMYLGFFIVALFALYMALGPSLKIVSGAPPDPSLGYKMPAEAALMPTGNAWIYKAIPGFDNMRSTYRWLGLCVFSCWLLVMFANAKGKKYWNYLLILVFCLNLPPLPERLHQYHNMRGMFLQIQQDLIPVMKQNIRPHDMVAFIPWGNDFFVNYLAPSVGFRTYNIGGDKNLLIAQKAWPTAMLDAGPAPLDEKKLLAALTLLREHRADVLVIPYIDLLWSAHSWPCPDASMHCVQANRESLKPMISLLQSMPDLKLTMTPWLVFVRALPA